MANKNLFRSVIGKLLPVADTVNEAGGLAYGFSDKHALAQYAATGCLNHTYYASAEEQLGTVLKLCETVEPEFIARVALFARQSGYMKDLPAVLCAVLSVKGPGLLSEVFDRVIDSPKMLRNFVQIMRSGAVGRKSLGTLPKRLILDWIEKRTDEQLFTDSVGQSPSMADIIKMVHPRPAAKSREALFGYLIGRQYDCEALPEIIRQFEQYKSSTDRKSLATPNVPFQMLTSLDLGKDEWRAIARNASWQMTRMNLNTFARHGVFEDRELTMLIAKRLCDGDLIAKVGVFPYQLMVAYFCADTDLPGSIQAALQDAMEIAIANVPAISGKVYVFPDVSGSMQSPVTGFRKGATTAVRCVDIAALCAAAILRRNPDAEVIPFSTGVVKAVLNPRDSVMTNAKILASLPSGGTNCSAPLKYLNDKKAKGDMVIYVSDNQSWVDSPCVNSGNAATETMRQWATFKGRNSGAKMICIDIQPYGTTQAQGRQDIYNVGGFSDQVFEFISQVAGGQNDPDFWVKRIEAVAL